MNSSIFRRSSTVALLLCALLVGCAQPGPQAANGAVGEHAQADSIQPPAPRQADLKAKLTPLQYEVTQNNGTERAFQNEFWNNHAPGIYVDVVDGMPLFSSTDKFDSGTGWPSFTKPLERALVKDVTDRSLGMARVEVRSAKADSHLGHVFPDGPKAQGGMRYCINSAALRFVPAEKLAAEGLGQYVGLFPGLEQSSATAKDAASATETAYLAGGCFWGMEELLREIPGVLDTEVGYTGGQLENPKYEDTHDSKSGHAEAVKIVFDPSKLSYEALLGWFFRMHDPTTLNRQGNDRGTQYRSAIFVFDAKQRATAEAVIAKVNAAAKWKQPIVTSIEPAGAWWPAESYHQDYLEKHPNGYSCHFLRD